MFPIRAAALPTPLRARDGGVRAHPSPGRARGEVTGRRHVWETLATYPEIRQELAALDLEASPAAARQDDIDVAPANGPIAIVRGAAPEFLSATGLQIFHQLSVASGSASRHLEMAENEGGARADGKIGVGGG